LSDKDSDQPRDPDAGAHPDAAGEHDGGDAAPPAGPAPATWAGRRGGASEVPADGSGDGEAAEPQAPEELADDELDEQDLDGEGLDDEDVEEEEPDDDALQEDLEDDEERDEEDLVPEPSENGEGDTAEGVSQDTVQADTLALADREASREAALTGLRARTAEHAAKKGKEVVKAPPPPAPQGAEAGPPELPPKELTAAAAPPIEPDSPQRRGLWPRFAVGSLLIIVSMATATALSLFFFLNGVLSGFNGVPGVQNELAVANPGSPQTILILGSDRRPNGQDIGARSDTTILLRIASNEISVLSIPRDLKVNIPSPGHGPDKFNAAYSYGGAKLTVKVVKQLTGITDINHVVNVDFTGFADAVNAIGCVYVDVDHHYYNSNVGVDPSLQYAEIDIPAGYQRMCGYNALQYVRYRHDDNDLVRSARQQEFLRELRQELPADRIANDFNQLKDILAKYVTLDIRNSGDLIALAQLIVSANNAPVVQVHFPANLGGPTASYVTASQSAIKAAVAKFEGQTPTPTPTTSTSGASSSGGGSSSKGGSNSGGSSGNPAPPPPPLIDASASAQQYAAQLAAAKTKSGKPMLDFPVYYPNQLIPDSTITSDSRAFPIDGPGSDVYRGYKMVVEVPTDGYLGYYGISGTDWKDPPILDHPDETRTLDGTDYLLSWDGPQLRLIGWKTDQGSYWIDNTLLNVLTPGQMFGIAQSMQKYTG
jgi:LCP family protein required for cell wall assembly